MTIMVKWHKNIVGCSIEVHKDGNTFDIRYYLNGECLGIAYTSVNIREIYILRVH